MLALQPRKRFTNGTVLIVDGTLVPTRDRSVAEQSKNYRYSTNHQVVVGADTRLVVVVGRPLPGIRNDCKAWEESGAKTAVGKTLTIADGGYPGTGLVMPHRRRKGKDLPGWRWGMSCRRRRRGSGAGTSTGGRCRPGGRVRGSAAVIPQVWGRGCISSVFPRARSSRTGLRAARGAGCDP